MNPQNTAGPSSRPGPTLSSGHRSRTSTDPRRSTPSESLRQMSMNPRTFRRDFRGQRARQANLDSSYDTTGGPLMASKSAYPPAHTSRSARTLGDDDSDIRSTTARMSSMSVRSATRSSTSSSRSLRSEPKDGRFYISNGEIVSIDEESSDDGTETEYDFSCLSG